MSTTHALVQKMIENKWVFYHFTDTRNLPLIRQHGILSMNALQRRNIKPTTGGNQWSLDADVRNGMDRFVHLCFFNDHPMEYIARTERRILETRFLRVDPAVLNSPGALISEAVSNSTNAVAKPIESALANLDLKVIYERTDWKDPEIQGRLRKAKKYELLIPNAVPVILIKNL